jgi:hypothetical protein
MSPTCRRSSTRPGGASDDEVRVGVLVEAVAAHVHRLPVGPPYDQPPFGHVLAGGAITSRAAKIEGIRREFAALSESNAFHTEMCIGSTLALDGFPADAIPRRNRVTVVALGMAVGKRRDLPTLPTDADSGTPVRLPFAVAGCTLARNKWGGVALTTRPVTQEVLAP